MNVSDFADEYARMENEPLLCIWADRDTLVPEAKVAVEAEVRKRGLRQKDADRLKKRLAALDAREWKGPLSKQIAFAKNERSLRHFKGPEEPNFVEPYFNRDIRATIARARFRYRVWKAFRDHTGHWPVFSIWFDVLSWIAFVALLLGAGIWMGAKNSNSSWTVGAIIGGILVFLGLRELGARLMRRLDWKRYGS